MHKKQSALEALFQQKLLPLYYNDSMEVSVAILTALHNAGIRILEYTNRGEHALRNFMQLKRVATDQMPGLYLGIGTIKTPEEANAYIIAGADFIVSPTTNPSVASAAHAAGLLWIPGCMTPTEIAVAEQAGAGLAKIFPGNILGPSYVSAIKDLFPNMKFMPTGGVETEENNLREWFSSGVVAVGMGSKLITKELITKGDYEGITNSAKSALVLIEKVTA